MELSNEMMTIMAQNELILIVTLYMTAHHSHYAVNIIHIIQIFKYTPKLLNATMFLKHTIQTHIHLYHTYHSLFTV